MGLLSLAAGTFEDPDPQAWPLTLAPHNVTKDTHTGLCIATLCKVEVRRRQNASQLCLMVFMTGCKTVREIRKQQY